MQNQKIKIEKSKGGPLSIFSNFSKFFEIFLIFGYLAKRGICWIDGVYFIKQTVCKLKKVAY